MPMFENYLCINGKKTELTDEMIEHIRDIIAWGLNEDFWSEDSLLAEGYYNTFNEVLNCEGFTIWDDRRNTVYITLQNGKEYKITIEEGEGCI